MRSSRTREWRSIGDSNALRRRVIGERGGFEKRLWSEVSAVERFEGVPAGRLGQALK
ncbi:MAG TPA: hypothetical protein VMM77_02010 [Gemmatimonadaceae bacterium]|nr:hypothetical protein [Gemmatimonadaceae bacterium]